MALLLFHCMNWFYKWGTKCIARKTDSRDEERGCQTQEKFTLHLEPLLYKKGNRNYTLWLKNTTTEDHLRSFSLILFLNKGKGKVCNITNFYTWYASSEKIEVNKYTYIKLIKNSNVYIIKFNKIQFTWHFKVKYMLLSHRFYCYSHQSLSFLKKSYAFLWIINVLVSFITTR